MRQRSFVLALAAGLMAFSLCAVSADADDVFACEAQEKFDFILKADGRGNLKADGRGNIAINFSDAPLTQINSDPSPARPNVSRLPDPQRIVVSSSDTVAPGTSYSLTGTSRALRTSVSVLAPTQLQSFCLASMAVWLLSRV